MKNYLEKEIKILNINVANIKRKLEEQGAKKVFDGKRIRTSFDNSEKNLINKGIEIRITEEGETKLSLDDKTASEGKISIKLKISRATEMEDFLARLDIKPVSRVESHRISYELDNIDFDIDIFPEIPPFLEIDLENFSGNVEELLKELNLENSEVFTSSTTEFFQEI